MKVIHIHVLQSPYGAFCLRPRLFRAGAEPGGDVAIPLRGFLFATLREAEERVAKLKLQSPYGAFCLRHTYDLGEIPADYSRVAIPLRGFLFATRFCPVRTARPFRYSCNPLTGLFVCDSIPR